MDTEGKWLNMWMGDLFKGCIQKVDDWTYGWMDGWLEGWIQKKCGWTWIQKVTKVARNVDGWLARWMNTEERSLLGMWVYGWLGGWI